MRCLSFIVGLMLIGWVSCVCQKEPGSRYRSINSCPITRMYQPVCASDGCTYINYSALGCAQREEPNLRVMYEGMCKDANDPVVKNTLE